MVSITTITVATTATIIEPAERESRRAPWGKHARNRRAADSWRKGEGAEAEMETKDDHIEFNLVSFWVPLGDHLGVILGTWRLFG